MKGKIRLNSLATAFSKAQDDNILKERKRAEAAIRKIPIILVVGLDFGTAFTKCMVRNLGGRDRPVHPMRFEHGEGGGFFLPSQLALRHGSICHPIDGQFAPDARPLQFLKMALVSAVKAERTDWLDGIVRTLGIVNFDDTLPHTQALVVFYLEGVLREVMNYIKETWPDFGNLPKDAIFYNMAVPVAHAKDAAMETTFLRCLSQAADCVSKGASLPLTVTALLEYLKCHPAKANSICALLPEVTANVQSYVKSRGGRHGLYLFADVGAGTVDFSVFIFYVSAAGDCSLTYPHAAVEDLGSSQMELRAYERTQHQLLNELRWQKENGTRNKGLLTISLFNALKAVQIDLRNEIESATECHITLARKKLRRWQFQTMQILFGGGGCSPDPYRSGITAAFKPRWGLTGNSQPLPVPIDIDWPADADRPFHRFSVAYGLTFLTTDAPIQRFPDEVSELDIEDERRPANITPAPTKDEV